MITSAGYEANFIRWGIIQGVVVVIAASFLKSPPAGWLPQTWRSRGSEEVRTRQVAVWLPSAEMALTAHFWLMYFMMTMVATGGLMATAQLAPMAKDFNVDTTPLTILGWTVLALPFALSLDRVINGICRPIWGWISDHIGREQTMALAFGLEAVAIYALIFFAHRPLLFVLFSAFTFFGWGEIYSLSPQFCEDFFGRKHATANYGFLYTAKGTASVLIPIVSPLAACKAFDFRADILLLLGGILVVFTMFLAPTVLKLDLAPPQQMLLLVASAL